jgi:TMEM175 potassium channel family protein
VDDVAPSDDPGSPSTEHAHQLAPDWRFSRGLLEFDRVSFFTDAVFAIAMTLLIVTIEPPTLTGDTASTAVLREALGDLGPQIFSFFLAFFLLARYWLAHHAFASTLDRVDRTLAGLTLCYLSFVAFLPFPTALVGEYGENPLSAVLFAVVLTIISGLETVMLWHAMRAGLTRVRPMPRPAYRYALIQSTTPTALIAASIPVAYANTIAAMTMWILAIPLGRIIDRIWPSGARAYTEVFRASQAASEGESS